MNRKLFLLAFSAAVHHCEKVNKTAGQFTDFLSLFDEVLIQLENDLANIKPVECILERNITENGVEQAVYSGKTEDGGVFSMKKSHCVMNFNENGELINLVNLLGDNPFADFLRQLTNSTVVEKLEAPQTFLNQSEIEELIGRYSDALSSPESDVESKLPLEPVIADPIPTQSSI